MNKMNVLVYGFGRMGLTHYSILNSILDDVNFTFVEPNKKLNYISRKNLDARFLSSDESITESFDLTLITTPPFVHESLMKKSLDRGDKNVFIEKPFGGHRNFSWEGEKVDNVYIGYVLRFNPIIDWIKSNIDPTSITKFSGSYLSNTIQNKPKGWRNGEYSGVLNEMGSHILDLANYICPIQDFEVKSKEMNSVVSDVDDQVKALILSNDVAYDFYFDWVDRSIRKPVFSIKIELKNGDLISFDQQKISIKNSKGEKFISVVDLFHEIPYYMRGVDFTRQMVDLTGEKEILCTLDEGLKVNSVMNKIFAK